MTREKLINELTAALKSLPSNVDVHISQRTGIARRAMCNGMFESTPTGTTVTIEINGGAQDIELEPEWAPLARGLNRV
jgi:hypothetical protein